MGESPIPSPVLDYTYATWPAGTVVTLANVPWDSTYRDIVRFKDVAAAKNYIRNNGGQTITVSNMTYAAQGRPIALNIPFSQCNTYNYIMVENPAMPISGDKATTFFYFINSVEYVAPNTTRLMVQLDVWTTYQYYVSFGRCFVERGHIGLYWDKYGSHNYGRRYLTVAEGQDLGSDYGVIGVNSTVLANSSNAVVCVVTTTSFQGSFGTVDNPQLRTAHGSRVQGVPNGAEVYYMSITTFSTFMRYMADYPWVAQGIVSITIIPSTAIDLASASNIATNNGNGPTLKNVSLAGGVTTNRTAATWKNFRASISANIPQRYRHLVKFQCYPYSVVEVTTYSGNPLLIKPEMVNSNDLTITQWAQVGPPAPRIMYTVNSLGQFIESPSDSYNGWSEHLDVATGLTNFPTTAVVNNSYLNYMASNAHSIAYQYDSADWSQQKALTAASNSYNMASRSMDAATNSTAISMGAASAQTALSNQVAQQHWQANTAFGVGTGIVGGAVTGGVAGAVAGGIGAGVTAAQNYVNMGIDNAARSASTAISNNAAWQQNANSRQLSTFARDTNYQYATYAANGDYANAIAGINARTQDAKMIQPTTAGQIGGDAFNFATGNMRLDIRLKLLPDGAMRRIGEYWLRYGYAYNRPDTLPDSLGCMSKFTYWKLSETYLKAATVPEMFKQAIRGIFEKGVTVWRRPEYIGVTDYADNTISTSWE